MQWMLMPLRRYADFSGRSRRMEFWMWQVAKALVSLIFWVLFAAVSGGEIMATDNDLGQLVAAGGALMVLSLICVIVGLGTIIPDLAVTVRRLHDTERSGWWILAPLVPYFVFWVITGTATTSGPSLEEFRAAGIGTAGLVFLSAAVAMSLVLLVFYFLDGTPGPNRFGPDPKGRDAEIFS